MESSKRKESRCGARREGFSFYHFRSQDWQNH